MAVLDLIDHGGQLAAQPLVQPHAEDLADAVGGQAPQADFATALEDFVDGEVAFEDEVAAVLDLTDGVEARQVHPAALFLGELRPQQEGPVVELLADDLGTKPVGGGLHCCRSPYITRLIRTKGSSFFDVLRAQLKWSDASYSLAIQKLHGHTFKPS